MPEFQILFADDHLLILNKPSGLLSVPGRGPENQDCLSARVQAAYPEALVVHRLDMSTSGIIVMARGVEVQRAMNRLFETRQVDKAYEAIVDGNLTPSKGSVDLPLICDWPNRPRQMVDHTIGKPSLTHYEVLSYDAATDTTRVRLIPHTGRSHQLRVHMQALGHPILGDDLYATPEALAKANRLLLHAQTIAFKHPITGENMHWICDWEIPPIKTV